MVIGDWRPDPDTFAVQLITYLMRSPVSYQVGTISGRCTTLTLLMQEESWSE